VLHGNGLAKTFAYLPSTRAVSADMLELSGLPMSAHRYDPATSSYTEVGESRFAEFRKPFVRRGRKELAGR
jgi:hypothetical protein